MKVKFISPVFSPVLLIVALLTSCMSSSDSANNTNRSAAPSSVTYTTPIIRTTPVDPPSESSWLRIPMHYQILLGQSHVWNERLGTQSLTLSDYASAGATTLKLSSSTGLVEQQLLTYRGIDGEYYATQIQRIEGNQLQLTTGLQKDVYAGVNAWNFYDDGSHPNWTGANAIADYSIRYLGYNSLNYGKHVLLGDSWFSRDSLYERLKSRLPQANVINKGIGGNTASQLLARFDADVSWQSPTHVWILTGTNDYWNYVSASTYKSNIKSLINRVQAIGAIPIVFDASVGPLNYGSDELTKLSRSYVSAIDQLAAEN